MVTSLQVGNPRLTDLVPRLRDLNVIRVKEKKRKKEKDEEGNFTTYNFKRAFYARLIYRSPKGIFKMTAIYIEEKIKSIIFNTFDVKVILFFEQKNI